jgi:hypothetical protein
VHRLLGIKPINNFTRYAWIAFFYLTFWTSFAPLVLFCKFIWKIFSRSFENSQRYMNKIARSIFKIWNFSPYFKCFSFDLTKLPLNEILLLVFKRVLIYTNWKYIRNLDTNWESIFLNVPIESKHTNFKYTNFFSKHNLKLGGGAVLLLWLNTFSPFGINRQKRRPWEPFFTFSLIGTSKYEWKIIPIWEWCGVTTKGKWYR